MSEWNETCSQAPSNREGLEYTPEKGRLQRQAEKVEQDVTQWPDSMKRAAGIAPAECPHPLVVENAELKQRAEAAEKALGELATASSVLVDALNTCHVCAGGGCLDTTEPTHCEDCSADCECHEGEECVPIYVLVDKVSAAIRAVRKGLLK